MKHATAGSLDKLDALLDHLREMAGLEEKRLGIFYFKSKAFLHFHEGPAGLFADLRVAGDWQRYPVSAAGERQILLDAVQQELGRT